MASSGESGGPSVRKVGWYRDRKTGRRSFWNGTAWVNLSDVVTPFTLEAVAPGPPPQPVHVPPPAPLPLTAAEPPKAGWSRRARATTFAVLAALVASTVLLLVLATNGSTPAPSTVGRNAPASPASAGASTADASAAPNPATSAVPSTIVTATTGVATVGSGGPGVSTGVSPGAPADVAIIGDSITVLATPSLERILARDDPYIDAVIGSTMAEHFSNIQQIQSDGHTRDWLIELGTNDALQNNSNWAVDFANEVDALASQRCVTFLTVNPRLGPIATGINQAIAQAITLRPNFHSIDWGNIEFGRRGWLEPDGVHPTKTGDVEIAKLERNALRSC